MNFSPVCRNAPRLGGRRPLAPNRRPSPPGESAIRLAINNAAEAGDEGGGTRDRRLANRRRNDIGNGERFRARYGNEFFYVPEIGWFAWVKTHWSPRDGETLSALAAQKVATKIFDEAKAIEEDPKGVDLASGEMILGLDNAAAAKALHVWAIKSGSTAALASMREASRPHLTRHVDELDVDPLLFNVQNGTIELGELEADGTVPVRLRRHARRDLITRIAPVGYDPEARSPLFDQFIAQILPDPDVRLWVQKLFGYCLTGLAVEHMLAAFWGDGRNGKSTLSRLFRWLFGDYAATIEFNSLLAEGPRRGGDATPDLAKLSGRRAVFAGEPREGVRLDDGKVKQITSGDPMSVRHLNREFFDLFPTFKLILSFNNKPIVKDDSNGMWSRVRLAPFTVEIPDELQDKTLLDKLRAEGPGVLNWALDGYRLWREEGLDPPQAMIAATREYRAENDELGQFVDRATRPDPTGQLSSAELYGCYLGWCRAMEKRPQSLTKLGTYLTKKRGSLTNREGGITFRTNLKWSGDIDWEWEVPLR
jgi:putative DNA primase/helicase